MILHQHLTTLARRRDAARDACWHRWALHKQAGTSASLHDYVVQLRRANRLDEILRAAVDPPGAGRTGPLERAMPATRGGSLPGAILLGTEVAL